MKAVICTEYGAPNVLKVMEVEKPSYNENEILIKVKATGVNVSDTVIRKLEAPGNPSRVKKQLLRTVMRLVLGFNSPKNSILGMVSAGVVVECGSNVSQFKVGDDVLSITGSKLGGYAEFKTAAETDVMKGELTHKPQNMSFEETVAIAYGGLLAIHFMRPKEIRTGSRVLIYGASGAIGTMAVQFAKAQGANVVGVCSAANKNLLEDIGADKIIDYTDKNAYKELETYDLIFDAVGYKKTSNLKALLKNSLAHSGRYVSVDDAILRQKSEYLKMLIDYADQNSIKAIIDKSFSLDEIVKAHTYVDKGHKKGNVIINV